MAVVETKGGDVMALLPVPSRIPGQNFDWSRADMMAAAGLSGLRGIGDTCVAWDDSGNCIGYGADTSITPISTPISSPGSISTATGTATAMGSNLYCTAAGDCYDSSGTPLYSYNPSGANTASIAAANSIPPGTTLSAGSGVTAAEIASINAAVKGGVQLASIAMLNPGMTVQANGTITYQNPGYPITIPGAGLAGAAGVSLATLFSNPIALRGIGMVFLVLLVGRK